jgi:nitrite reductase/ring-hydroxylating ferredoxin subunit
VAEPANERVPLFPAAELAPGQLRSADVGGVAVVVIRTPSGSLYALRDVCPHLGAPLSSGFLARAVDSDAVGTYRLSDDWVVHCPWHGHEFSVSTGRCVADPQRIRVRAYRVDVEDGTIVLRR